MNKKIIKRGTKWQAPGNGSIFDCYLDSPLKQIQANKKSSFKMTALTLTTLKFIYEYQKTNTGCTTPIIKSNIKKYWEKEIEGYKINKTLELHYIRTLVFYGLVEEIPTDQKNVFKYILSIDGKKMYEYTVSRDYLNAIKYFILTLLRVKYPNLATKKTQTPSLYPFRILFYLFKKYGKISSDDIQRWIPFIVSKKDLNKSLFVFLPKESKYDKWKTWIFSSLTALHILKKDPVSKCWYINQDELDIWLIIKNTGFIDDEDTLFTFNKNNYIKNVVVKKNRIGFSVHLKEEIKKQQNYFCWFDSTHKKIETKKGIYLPVHHVIPYEMKDSFPELNINSKENLIAICNDCHTILHYGKDQDKRKLLLLLWNKKQTFLKKYLSSFDEFYSMYSKNN